MAVTLSPEDAQALTAYAAAVKELQADIAKAKRAGVNTSVLEANLAQVDALRRGLLREFAPKANAGG